MCLSGGTIFRCCCLFFFFFCFFLLIMLPRFMKTNAQLGWKKMFLSSSYSTFQKQEKVMMTGGCGQIGSELFTCLQKQHGMEQVITTDIRHPGQLTGKFSFADVRQIDHLERVIVEENVTTLIHLSGILSAVGEMDPLTSLQVNVDGSRNALELARRHNLKIFIPSSIAAFGPETPPNGTPDVVVQRPTTVYGISKVFVEHLGTYYRRKYNVDFRSLRYPGVISNGQPGGGTTDYAIEMLFAAARGEEYNCWLEENSFLPMVHMDDCIGGTLKFLSTPKENLSQCVYNVQGCSFSPKLLYEVIKKDYPDFQIHYKPEAVRQSIADSWPNSLDDTLARQDWGWDPNLDLQKMVSAMFHDILQK